MTLQPVDPPRSSLPDEIADRIERINSDISEIASMLEAAGEKYVGPAPEKGAELSSPTKQSIMDRFIMLGNTVIRLRIAANRIT